jgi:hypothetical protein
LSRWFRFYDEALNDPKVQRLHGDTFKAWVNILCLSSKCGGAIVRSDIAFHLRISEESAEALIDTFIELNLLEDRGDVVTPHNWDGRQFKSDKDPTNNERQQRHRNALRNGPSNAPSNGQITPTEQNRAETEQKKKETRAKPACPRAFEAFWKDYPKTPVMSKKEAATAWGKLSAGDQSAALLAVAPFNEWLAKQKDHPVVHACRFLSQRRFDGFKPSPEIVSTMVFVRPGTEAWDAWQAVKPTPTNKDGGWYFESEYPPNYEPKAA